MDPPAAASETHFEARIEGMHCAGCVASIEKSVGRVSGVESARVNLANGGLSVRFAAGSPPNGGAGTAPPAGVAEAVAAAGPYRLVCEGPEESFSPEPHPARGFAPVGIALGLAALAMAVAMSGFGASGAGRVLQFLLATTVLGFAGRGFAAALAAAIRHRVFGMDSLIGLGAGTAWFASTLQLAGGGPAGPLFFDTAAIVVAIVRLGRWLEDRARGRASEALRRLLAIAPDRARVLRADSEVLVEVAAVAVGERILVRPGERVPLDGRIVRGGAAMDESLVSGESIPVERTVSDAVIAGARNLTGAIEVEVSRAASESTLSRIASAVRRAQAEKVPIQRAADRVASVFVPVVMVVAAATAVVWLFAGSSGSFALSRSVAVLVVSCPCALGLAAPIAVLVATGRSARQGILFRSGSALEGLAAVRAIGLDKTGTVTAGEPEVVTVSPGAATARDELLRLAASAEQGSEHPLGAALVAFARCEGISLSPLRRFEALPGRGVAATLEGGEIVWVGSRRLARERGFEPPEPREGDGASGWLQVICGSEHVGAIGFRDRPRPEASELVRRLAEDGLPAALLSGDEPAAVAATGAAVGIRRTAGGLLPAAKLAAIDRLRAEYGPVAMVGDGINDAPALARADVGIALAEGTEVAREAAAVTLMRPDLRLVSTAVRLARRSLRVIRQNLFWAFAYNIAAIPLAAGVFYPATGMLLSPEIAAAAMAFSSISVVLNALRLSSG